MASNEWRNQVEGSVRKRWPSAASRGDPRETGGKRYETVGRSGTMILNILGLLLVPVNVWVAYRLYFTPVEPGSWVLTMGAIASLWAGGINLIYFFRGPSE